MTLSILLIVLLIVLGLSALGWSNYCRQQFKRATVPGCAFHSVPLPEKRLTILRTRLSYALVAVLFSGLALLLGPRPSAWASSSHPLGNKGASLLAGQSLNGDDYLESPNGQYVALMQDDGNFVLYHVSSSCTFTNPYWATNTGGVGQGFAIMQTDGNFVLYHGTSSSPGAPYWASNTDRGASSYHLDMQDDGNLVLYNGGTAPWASNTVAGVGLKLTIASGNNQTQPRLDNEIGSYANFGPLTVTLTDNIGDLLSDQRVTWSVASQPAHMQVTLASITSTTDANGIATLSQLGSNSAVAYADGAFTVVASSGSASVTFNLTVSKGPYSALSVIIVAGNNQSVGRTGSIVPGGIANFAPLQVKVLDANAQLVSGIYVVFDVGNTPRSMAVDLNPQGDSSAEIKTDSNGIATLNIKYGYSMSAYYATGPFTIVASTDGGSTITFNETVSS